MAEVVCPKQKSRADKIAFIFLMCCGLFITSAMYSNEHYPQIVETAHAEEVEEFTHYVVEYYVDGTRYVRWVETGMWELVAGTAKDFGIKAPHLQAICLQEGTEFVDGYAFACSQTAIGDNGHAFGAFQIHTGINYDIARDDAKHPYYSARWTSERLLRKGYEKNAKWAIQCHNGCNKNLPYANRIWQIARTMKIIKTDTL